MASRGGEMLWKHVISLRKCRVLITYQVFYMLICLLSVSLTSVQLVKVHTLTTLN